MAAWLAADPRHETAFLAVEETWHRIGKAGAFSHPAVAPAGRRPRRWLLPLSLAAAATVALASVAGWRVRQTGYASINLTEGHGGN